MLKTLSRATKEKSAIFSLNPGGLKHLLLTVRTRKRLLDGIKSKRHARSTFFVLCSGTEEDPSKGVYH
jgi:hypothetical protein